MSKVNLIKTAKSIRKFFKKQSPAYISYCRRIERVKTNERVCAMTFDDGPTYASDITLSLVDTLDQHSAKGTFDIIGTTENNYPDTEGKIGTPSWSGVRFDHYPCFNEDKTAGAVNCPDLIDKIIASGHEITNHTYSHILFGKKNVIYSKRCTLQDFDEVYTDVNRLHTHLSEHHGYEMKFSRPPHYVDKIRGGFTSYDVYSRLGYNYLAASFDGAGWLPSKSESVEISAMTAGIEAALANNPDALCGQIIFQKDGYNMALRAPVKKGLEKQLEILDRYGYKVVTVSELLELSPFSDIGREDEDFELFKTLAKERAVVYSDNCLRPDAPMTKGELAMLIAPKEIAVDERIRMIKANTRLPYSLKARNPYSSAMLWCIEQGYISPDINGKVTKFDLELCSNLFDCTLIDNEMPKKREILRAYKYNFNNCK